MKLILFKIGGYYDYGALSFEQSGTSVEECYEQMLKDGVTVLQGEGDEPEWELSIEKEFLVRDREEADKIVEALDLLSSEEWIGDYDSLKNTNWLYLVVD